MVATNNGYGQGLGDAHASEPRVDLLDYARVLLRSKALIALAVLGATGVATYWVGTRTPTYRARATLLLEKDEAIGGVLSDLASLGAEPSAQAEIALLTSQSLAAVTVDGEVGPWEEPPPLFRETAPDFDPFAVPEGAAVAQAQGDPSAMETLGLACTTDRADLRPFATMKRRALGAEEPRPHRLHARMEPTTPDVLARATGVGVRFVEGSNGGTVALHAYGRGEEHELELTLPYEPGMEVEVPGWRLWLHAVGDYADQAYTVRMRTKEGSVESLQNRVQAVESSRKSNVVYVFVQDSDPYRAAETANALCKNYIRRNVGIGRQKATQTVRFIDAQLAMQLEALKQAELSVVELQTAHPEAIALSASAEALIEQISSIELQRTQVELALSVIRDALASLAAGDVQALARLGNEMPNLIALAYIKELGQLETESLRLDRTDFDGYKGLLTAERQRLRSLADANELHGEQLQQSLAALRAGDASGFAPVAGTEQTGEPFQDYVAEIAKLDAELSRQRGLGTDQNPHVRSLVAARAELVERLGAQVEGVLDGLALATAGYRRLIDDYTRSLAEWPGEERGTIEGAVTSLRASVRTSLEAQAAGLAEQLRAIDESKSSVEARLAALPQSELALLEPLRERAARTKIVEFLLTSQQEAQITAAATSAAAVLIDPALPPPRRIFPQVTVMIGLGAFVGLLLGCALALAWNAYRAALYTEAEIERATGLSVVGSVPNYLRGRTRLPNATDGKRLLPMRDAPDSAQAEAFRQIRASLRLMMSGDEELRTLAVTSCVPKEGKSVTNADLALVFAAAGRRVLLVDSDLRRPTVHTLFDLDRGPGFAEVLEQRVSWRECVHRTGPDGLEVLPAGKCQVSPGELLAGDRVMPVIHELLEEYDLVVFDLPPAVVVADVQNFAHKLDAVLLLYRVGGVSGHLLNSAVGRLRRAGVRLMGVIANAVYVPRAGGGYGDGYGYSYGDSYVARKPSSSLSSTSQR